MRKHRSEEMRIKTSRLPHRKTLDGFYFGFQPGIDKRQIDALAALAFTARAKNVILLGPPGVGKTHLAIGFAMQALKFGLGVYYASFSQLIADLRKVRKQNRLERRWRVYLRPDILIIGEVGYRQLDRMEAELLFRLVCERYEHGSIILTRNKFFSGWGELMSDTTIGFCDARQAAVSRACRGHPGRYIPSQGQKKIWSHIDTPGANSDGWLTGSGTVGVLGHFSSAF